MLVDFQKTEEISVKQEELEQIAKKIHEEYENGKFDQINQLVFDLFLDAKDLQPRLDEVKEIKEYDNKKEEITYE